MPILYAEWFCNNICMAALALEFNIVHQETHIAQSSFTQISIKYTLPKVGGVEPNWNTAEIRHFISVHWPTHKNVQSLLTSCFPKLGSILIFVSVKRKMFNHVKRLCNYRIGSPKCKYKECQGPVHIFMAMRGITGCLNVHAPSQGRMANLRHTCLPILQKESCV